MVFSKTGLLVAAGRSAFITICSVIVIVLLTSMAAWWITRVTCKLSTVLYYLFVFAMIVPFQMVMFTLSKVTDFLHLGNMFGIIPVYLGFGARVVAIYVLWIYQGDSDFPGRSSNDRWLYTGSDLF